MKSPKEIRDELLGKLLALEESYLSHPSSSNEKIDYLYLEQSEAILNYLKSLDYHYREEVPGYRVKKSSCLQLKESDKMIKKYAEDPKSESLELSKKFDSGGYLENRDFFSEISTQRAPLKR